MAQKNILTNFTVVAGVEGQNTLQSLAKQLDGLSFSAKKLSKDLQASSGATGIQQITRDADKAKVSVNGLTAALDDYRVKIAATTVIAQQFVKTLIGILEVQGRIDQLEVNLDLVNDGNTRKIGEDLEFLRDVTNRLGLEFSQTSVLYTKFAAATKESGFTAAEAREVFDSFAGATARLSLSTDSANRVFFALQQIVSKGTVSSEELKNQLGEKIPGVMAIAAKAFDGGKGDIEAFNKALADGKVRVDDFLIPFAEGIRESLGVASGESVNTATAAFGRFKNSYEDLLRAVVDSGLGDAVVRLFDGATGAIGSASEAIRDLKADTQEFFDAIDFEKLQLLAEVFVGIKGASVGAATGAAIGSAFPGIGTAVGAAVGAGVGYLGGAAGTNEVINQARFGKQEAFNELLERQVEIEKQIIEITNRRDSTYGKNFLNQKALTEEIQALQMEGLNIDLQIINSSKEVSSAVVAYQKDISKSFADAEAAEKQAERERKRREKEASDAAEERLKQSKALQKELLALVSKESLRGDILKEQIKLGRELTDTEKQYIEDVKKFGKVQAERLKLMREENDLRQEGIDLRKEEAKFTQALEKTARDEVKEYEARTKQLEEEIQRIGLKTEALAELEAQSLLTQAAQAREAAEDVGLFNPQLYESRIRQAEEFEKQAGLVKQRAAKETAVKIAEDQAKEFEKIQDDIAQSLTDAIFQGGKKGSEILKNLFKAQVFRIFIEPSIRGFVGSLAGAFGFGGAASAAEGAAGAVSQASGLGNLVSGVKSVYDVVSNGFTGLSTQFSQMYVKAAEFFGANTSATYANAFQAGQLAGAAAIAIGGRSVGKLVSGGYALGGGSGNSAINVGGLVGAGLGGTFGALGAAAGPLGALVGAGIGQVVGGLVNRLFGKKTVLGASGIEGTFDSEGLSNARTFQDFTVKRKFRSSKSGTTFGALDPKVLKAINDAFGDVSKAAQDASRALGSNFTAAFESFKISGRLGRNAQSVLNKAGNEFVTEIIKQTFGSTLIEEEIKRSGFFAAIARRFNFSAQTQTVEVMSQAGKEFLDFLKSIKQDQEQLIDAYVRVARSVTVANRAMFALGQTAQFSIRNAETAFELVTVLGDQGVQLLDQFVARFVPASEQAEIAAKNFELSLNNLGLETKLSANTTREEFKKLVQGLDLTTAAGQRELQTLLQIMPEFDAIISRREQEKAAAEALGNALTQVTEKIRADVKGLKDSISQRSNLIGFSGLATTLKGIADQVERLSSVVVDVDFSQFIKGIAQVSQNIAEVQAELAKTTDAGTRLQLEDQLQQAIVARYELEQQMLGGVFASIQDLFGQIQSERIAVRNSATQILGGARVLSASEIRSRILQTGAQSGNNSFAEQAQMFVIDASRAATELGKLREETVRYFEEQQRLSQALSASSQGLKDTASQLRFAGLSAEQQLAQLSGQFESTFARALTLQGDDLAVAGSELNALINPILQTAQQLFGDLPGVEQIRVRLIEQAESIASRIDGLTPKDFQQESLALLGQIDNALASLESTALSTETSIVDSITLSADRTIAALAEIHRAIDPTGPQAEIFSGVLQKILTSAQATSIASTQSAAVVEPAVANQISQIQSSDQSLLDLIALASEQQRLNAIALERLELERQLIEATETQASRLAKQREALDESNRAIFDQIQAVNDVKSAYLDQSKAAEGLRDRFRSFADNLAQYRNNLFAANNALPEGRQLALARARFNQVVADTNSSDLSVRERALTEFTSVADEFLGLSQQISGSFNEYLRDFSLVSSATVDAQNSALATASVQELQLTALEKMVEGIVDVERSVLSLPQALLNLTSAGFVPQTQTETPVIQAMTIAPAPIVTPTQNTSTDRLEQQLVILNQKVEQLMSENRAAAQAMVVPLNKTAKILERADDGDAITVRVEQ